VIVLSEGSFVDATAIRRSLAAHTVEPDDAHVVVEIGNPRVARSFSNATSDAVSVISVDDIVSDMLAQSVRRPHLADVFDQLLSYGGSELYVVPAGRLAGTRFWDAVRTVDGMALIGVMRENNVPLLLPEADRVLKQEDQVVVIAAGAAPPRVVSTKFAAADSSPDVPEPLNTLLIGWNDAAGGMLDRLADYLPARSRVDILADKTLLSDGAPVWSWPFEGSFAHTKHQPGHILGVIQQQRPEVIVVLGYSDGMNHPEADALTLLTLMTLERARHDDEIRVDRIVAQLFDRDLAPLAGDHVEGGDFIITDALASRLLVHASRNPGVAAAYHELFDAAGPIVDLFDIEPGDVSYGSVVSSMARDGIIPIGVIVDGTVTLTPPMSSGLDLGAGDHVVAVRPSTLREIDITFERVGAPVRG
jgi:hypothetical protein